MLTFLLQDNSIEDSPPVAASPLTVTGGDWWNFEPRALPGTPHPAAAWVVFLLHGAATTSLPCPRCGREASVGSNLDHLLRHHRAGYDEAAAWLEGADPDLFSLAVHYLASKARAGRSAST